MGTGVRHWNLRQTEVDLWSGEAVKQDHAAGQEGTQDQAFAHGPPLPPLLDSHGPAESRITLMHKSKEKLLKVFLVQLHCHLPLHPVPGS